ncbi:MAG: hypothetical protein J6589_10615 [Snodgrassella sp.]|uniref:hypothetical protein n=1 Tax=Snodgrassella sp. TaxID=2815304 RepID=UPI002583BD1D|nr:hypothetical protein [Snodgrassella sp.]MCO6514896.1 hypothetical protein [Snodgrassella sp.]
MKFIYRNDKTKDFHWKLCEKNHAPFIELSNINNGYTNIFFDITNYHISLEEISDDIKKLYSAYIEFFMLSDPIIQETYDQYYFFNLIVKSEHANFLAENLYDYLSFKLGNY